MTETKKELHEAMLGLTAQHPNLLLPGGPPPDSFAAKVWAELSEEQREVVASLDPGKVEAAALAAADVFRFVYPAGI